ncbi:MAG TPA: hypothetical protein VFL93_03395 [Longimicrobiaceae bacterium]|nr:hypothetical protein [Longimicrobiaceae bacterium]
MTQRETNRATVARLMSILGGETPIEAGAELIAADVVAHVDRWTFRGIDVWASWIHYIRTRPGLTSPTLAVDALEVHRDATVTARARWRALRAGRLMISDPGVAHYRLVDGRIVEIWSTRHNYAFLCGGHVHSHWGFALELLRVRRWKRGAAQVDLRRRAAPAAHSPRVEPTPTPLIAHAE